MRDYYYFTSANTRLIEAAYPNQNLDYTKLHRVLKVYSELSIDQERLKTERWESIKVRRDQKGIANAVIVTTDPNAQQFFDKANLEKERMLCSSRIAAYIRIDQAYTEINSVERSIIIRVNPAGWYRQVVESLLFSELNFEELEPNFNQKLPTINHDYLEQLKQKPLADLATLLGAPVEPLLLILEANPNYAPDRS